MAERKGVFKHLKGLDARGLQVGELSSGSLSASSLTVSTMSGQNGSIQFTEPLADVSLNSVTISGGTIDGTAIGSSEPDIGIFSNLQVAGDIIVSGNITSSTTSTANLGNLQVVNNTIYAIAPTPDGDIILDPLGAGNITFNGPVQINATTGSNNIDFQADDTATINADNHLILTSTAGDIAITSNSTITMTGTQILLSPSSSVLLSPNKPLNFANASNYISSDATNLSVQSNSGAINIDANSNINLNQKTIISGSLSIDGSTSTTDPVITVGDSAVATTQDRGIEFLYNDGSAKRGFFGWDQSLNEFVLYTDATNSGEVFSGTLGTAAFGTINAGTVNSTTENTTTVNATTVNAGTGNYTIINATTLHGDPDLTLTATNDINLSATNNVNIPVDVGLTFGGDTQAISADSGNNLSILAGNDILLNPTSTNTRLATGTDLVFGSTGTNNTISSNGTNLSLNSTADIELAATSNVNIPTNVGLTFGADAQNISGNGTNLTISSGNNIALVPTAEITVPANKPITFGGNNNTNIQGDGTDISLNSNNAINLVATSEVAIPANIPVSFGANINTNIQGNGTNLSLYSDNYIELTPADSVTLPLDKSMEFGETNTVIFGSSTAGTATQANPATTTDLHIEAGQDIYLTPGVNRSVIMPQDSPLQFGNSVDNRIEYDGSDLSFYSSGNVISQTDVIVNGTLTVTGGIITSSQVTANSDQPIIILGNQVHNINRVYDGSVADSFVVAVSAAHNLIVGDAVDISGSDAVPVIDGAYAAPNGIYAIPTLANTVDVSSGSATVSGTGFLSDPIVAGDYLSINTETKKISSIDSDVQLTMESTYSATATGETATISNQFVIVSSGYGNITTPGSATGTVKSLPTVDDGQDRGIEVHYHTGATGTAGSAAAFFGFDRTDERWKYFTSVTDSGNIISGTLGEIEAGTLYIDIITAASGSTVTVSGEIDMSANKITNLADPTANSDAVTLGYLQANGAVVSTVALSGTSYTTISTKQLGTLTVSIEPVVIGGPAAIFHIAKNLATKLPHIVNIIRVPADSSGEYLELTWNVSSNLQMRKSGANYDGNYTVKIM